MLNACVFWRSTAASKVSMKVVIFAPMIYGITFSRRTKPRLLSGTRMLKDRLTDIDTSVTRAPNPSITTGLYTKRDIQPTWLSLSVICGRHLSKSWKLTIMMPRPTKKTPQSGRSPLMSPAIGSNKPSIKEVISVADCNWILSNLPDISSTAPNTNAGI